MSVFTTVSTAQLQHWLQGYAIGELLELKGISAGITNTNYFVTTTQNKYVLTLFEHNAIEELPFFIELMDHLAHHGVPCPQPISNSKGESLHMLNGKPAVLISCLRGRDIEAPTAAHCGEVGAVLANMHIAGLSFQEKIPRSHIVIHVIRHGARKPPLWCCHTCLRMISNCLRKHCSSS